MGNNYKSNLSNIPTGTLEITENGTYDVTEYAEAEVAIPYIGKSIFCKLSNFLPSMYNKFKDSVSKGALYQGKIHIMAYSNLYFTYDVTTDTFTQVTTPFSNFSVSNQAGNLVVYNQELHAFSYNGQHWKYDGTNWTQLSDSPLSYGNFKTVVFDNEIHLIGGNGNYSKYHYKWDGVNWAQLSNLPMSVTFEEGACVYNGKIHIAGNSYHYEYDGTDWTQSSMGMPSNAMDYCQPIVFNNEMYLLGGKGSDMGNIFKYKNNQWTLDLLFKTGSSCMIKLMGGVYVPIDTGICIFGDYNMADISILYCPDAKIMA